MNICFVTAREIRSAIESQYCALPMSSVSLIEATLEVALNRERSEILKICNRNMRNKKTIHRCILEIKRRSGGI